jgi:hypothetical protein
MPDNFDILVNPADDDTPLITQLRRALKNQGDALRKAEQETVDLRTKDRGRELTSILTDKKFDPRVAALIPADVAIEPEAVTDWLAEHGIAPVVAAPADPAVGAPAPTGVDPAVLAAFAQAQQAGHEGTPPVIPAGQLEQQLAKAAGAKSEKEFYEAFGVRA